MPLRGVYSGREWVVTQDAAGFWYNGTCYRTMTAVVRAIMGSDWTRDVIARQFLGMPAYDGPRRPRGPRTQDETESVQQQDERPRFSQPGDAQDEHELRELRRQVSELSAQRNSLLQQRDAQACTIDDLRRQLTRASREQADTVSMRRHVEHLTARLEEATQQRDAIAKHVRGVLAVLGQLKADQDADDFLGDLLAQAKAAPASVRFTAEGGVIGDVPVENSEN